MSTEVIDRPTIKERVKGLLSPQSPEEAYRQHVFSAVNSDDPVMEFAIIDRADRMTADFARHCKLLRQRREAVERRRVELPRLDAEIAELERRDAEFHSIGAKPLTAFATLTDLHCALENLRLSASMVDSPFRQAMNDARDLRAGSTAIRSSSCTTLPIVNYTTRPPRWATR